MVVKKCVVKSLFEVRLLTDIQDRHSIVAHTAVDERFIDFVLDSKFKRRIKLQFYCFLHRQDFSRLWEIDYKICTYSLKSQLSELISSAQLIELSLANDTYTS